MWCFIIIVIIRFDNHIMIIQVLVIRTNMLLSNTTSSNITSLNSELLLAYDFKSPVLDSTLERESHGCCSSEESRA